MSVTIAHCSTAVAALVNKAYSVDALATKSECSACCLQMKVLSSLSQSSHSACTRVCAILLLLAEKGRFLVTLHFDVRSWFTNLTSKIVPD